MSRQTVPQRIFGLALLFLLFFLNSISTPGQESKPSVTAHKAPKPASSKSNTFTLVGAGDIAGCDDLSGAKATAKLIEHIPGAVFAAGDLAYETGSDTEFRDCYGPTWGKFKDRTYPAPGNHEYDGSEATGYFRYWGKQAGEPEKGYYSYDLGDWHIVVLNTNCNSRKLGGCAPDSPQETWLRQDLAEHHNACLIAYGHHALFSSGVNPRHAIHPELQPLWRDLYEAHADVILAGHEHSYERFDPQDPDGHADAENGIREIVVGTGGKNHTPLGLTLENSEVRNDNTFGVLELTLSPGKYTWKFIPVPGPGERFKDSGSGTCHNQPSSAN
jgi:hypothetical protein